MDIDWNGIWKQYHAEKKARRRDPDFWNNRAPEFARHARHNDDYVGQFLAVMKPQSHWNVLDVGCAAGTLAVPMAPQVKSVTAVDPSKVMRDLLHERCEEEGIDNIDIINGKWEDDWDELGIGAYEVVIASRSLIVSDFMEAIKKLRRHSVGRIMISTLVGNGPYDAEILNAVGRDVRIGPDYIVCMNILRQMEIYPNLTFTYTCEQPVFRNLNEALDSMRWMVHGMTDEEEDKLRPHLERTLVFKNGRYQMPYTVPVRWAIIWWDKVPSPITNEKSVG